MLSRHTFAILMALILHSRLAAQADLKEAAVKAVEKDKITKLIDRLTEIDQSDYGYSASVNGEAFLPVDAAGTFTSGLLFQPSPKRSPVLSEIVAYGIEAVPILLDHLDDPRRTKIRIFARGTFMVNDGRANSDGGLGGGLPNSALAHSITVGDLCYFALGQIVDYEYRPVAYVPSAITIVNSPTRSADLSKTIRKQWKDLTPRQHRDSLMASMRRVDSSVSAAKRFAFYYPAEFETAVVKLLDRRICKYDSHEINAMISDVVFAKEEVDDAQKKLSEFIAKSDEQVKIGVENTLYNWLERRAGDDDDEYLRKAREELAAQIRALLVRHFKAPKNVRADDRSPKILCWTPDGLVEFLESLVNDDSLLIDRAVRGLFDKNSDPGIRHACLKRLVGRGFDEEIRAISDKERDPILGSPFDDLEAKLGQTRLHLAAERQHLERVRRLIAGGKIDIDHADRSGETALHLAARTGSVDVIRELVSAKAGLDKKNKAGQTPLEIAISQGHLEAAMPLLDARVNGVNLLTAIVAGDLKAVDDAIRRDSKAVNERTFEGWTPLHLAAWKSDEAIVDSLLRAGAEVNADNNTGETPLHLAVGERSKAAVQRLLVVKADVHAKTKYEGLTPLAYAVDHGSVDIAELLLTGGADAKQFLSGDYTLQHLAAIAGHVEMIKLLEKHKVSIATTSANQETPLHVAARMGRTSAAAYLIEKGADVDARDKNRSTPLHAAIRGGNIEVAELLLRKGADPRSKDVWGVDPLRIAQGCREPEIEKLVRSRMAK